MKAILAKKGGDDIWKKHGKTGGLIHAADDLGFSIGV
jgi:hypothetical protein